MTTTGRRAMAMAMVTSTKWNILETGRTMVGVQTGVAGWRGAGTGLKVTEDGLPPDTGAGEKSNCSETGQYRVFLTDCVSE